MKSTRRRAAAAAGLLPFIAAPLMAQATQPAQRGGPPNSDTPYILVTTFHSKDRQLGVQLADELRKRVQQEHPAKELFVIPKNTINATLTASGYPVDSALSATDIMELARGLRGEIATDGAINKSAAGVKVDATIMMKAGQAIISQPLTTIDAKDVGDAAKQFERQITESNKALTPYKTCKNSLLAAKYPEAVTAARAGIAAYANSTFSRLCLLSAFNLMKAPPDSIIAVATGIKALDPMAMIARSLLADAYIAKGDTAHAIEEELAIYRIDPANTSVVEPIILLLAQSGAPDKALPILDTLMQANPGDPKMLRTKWALQLAAAEKGDRSMYKRALGTGEEYVKADTAAATLEYYQRQIGVAQKDTNAAGVMEMAGKGARKFPKEVTFHNLLARGYLVAGQLPQALGEARQALDIDPKNQTAVQYVISAFNQLHQPDSAIAAAQKAVAAGVPKADIGAQLLAAAGPALAKAQESKTREDWQAALKAFETVDAIAPSAQSSFYIGVAAYTIAGDIATDIQKRDVQKLLRSTKKPERDQVCAESKDVEDLLAKVAIAMPKGGTVNKDAAAQILTNLPGLSDFNSSLKKAFCR